MNDAARRITDDEVSSSCVESLYRSDAFQSPSEGERSCRPCCYAVVYLPEDEEREVSSGTAVPSHDEVLD